MASLVAGTAQGQQGKDDSVPVHDEEFRFLLDYLKRTSLMMLDCVRDVSARQWTFKAKPHRWSVAECAEHIILAEGWLTTEFDQKFAATKEPAYIFHWRKPTPKAEDFSIVPMSERRLLDVRILNNTLDRSMVDSSVPGSPPPEVKLAPQMKYKYPEEMLADFEKVRRIDPDHHAAPAQPAPPLNLSRKLVVLIRRIPVSPSDTRAL